MAEQQVTQEDVDELVELMREAASAYIGGDIRRYFELMQHADDFTLMDPFGGETSRESVRARSVSPRWRSSSKAVSATLDVVRPTRPGTLPCSSPSSISTATSATIRPRTGRSGQRWCSGGRTPSGVVHRHADPLVHPITFDQLSELARG